MHLVPTPFNFLLALGFLLFLGTGCFAVGRQPKYTLADGRYQTKLFGARRQPAFLLTHHDTVFVYLMKYSTATRRWALDTATARPVLFTPETADTTLVRPNFQQGSFDLDFLTIPFKYRPAIDGFPRQFTTSLNGAVYIGYRSDQYRLGYPPTLLGRTQRQTTHFGFSLGGFSGLGGTVVNPSVTRDRLAIEYDGVVWSKGLAAIVGLNNFTAGLALGWDHLLDPNRRLWIYQGQPWVGVVFGLNLN